jgi:hypothetical protein
MRHPASVAEVKDCPRDRGRDLGLDLSVSPKAGRVMQGRRPRASLWMCRPPTTGWTNLTWSAHVSCRHEEVRRT